MKDGRVKEGRGRSETMDGGAAAGRLLAIMGFKYRRPGGNKVAGQSGRPQTFSGGSPKVSASF